MKDILSLDVLTLRKKQTNRKPQRLTTEQNFEKSKRKLINKIERGDLDIKNNQTDKRLYYWGVKNGIIDKDLKIL